MNGYLRQSTASQSRLIGPFVDDTDFKTAETALSIANTDIKLRANGTTLSSKSSGGGTHQVNGMYSVTFDATDTANVGELFFSVVVSGALAVFGAYTVLEESVYDALFAASALGYVADQPVNATKIGGTSQTGRDIGANVLLSPGTGTGQVDLSSGKVLLQATQTGVTIPTITTLTNAPSDSSGVTTLLSRLSALRAGYLDNLSAGAVALESSLETLITTIGAAGAGLTATASAVWSVATRLLTAGTNIVLAKGTGITGFNDLSAAAVNAEVDSALADYDGPTHSELTAELAVADDGTLAAIGALNNLSQANVRSAVGLASANLDTQISDIPTVSEIVAGMFLEDSGQTFGDAIDGSVVKETANNAGGSSPTANEIADAVWSALNSVSFLFPTSPIVDDFNRTDQGPPPSADWTNGFAGGFGGSTEPGHEVLSNELGNTFNDVAQNWYNVFPCGPDCDVYLTITDVTGVLSWGLAARLTEIDGFSSNGYAVIVNPSGITGENRGYAIYRIDNGAITSLASGAESDVGVMSGDTYGIRVMGNNIQLWADTGEGWKMKLSAVDSTHKGAGYAGVITESGPLARWDNFGAGNIVFPVSGSLLFSAAAIADSVWDEDINSAHQTPDTAGNKLNKALILYEGD